MREITIEFGVTGTCCQTIRLDDECELTNEEIIAALNGGGDTLVLTTVQEGGEVLSITANKVGLSSIGKVLGSDCDCEYEDFEDVSPEEL